MEYTKRSEPSHLYKLWCGISCIAACLRRKCKLEWGFRPLYPNLYVVLVGPSGSRKGTAMAPALQLLRNKGIKIAAEAITREALIRELCNTLTDTVVDADGMYTEAHSSLTIFSEELTVFLGYDNKQLMSDLTDWYDCRSPWIYRTKTAGEDEIIGTWVNLIGATTPELLQSTLTRDAIGGGLTSRIIFVYGDRKSRLEPNPHLTQHELDLQRLLSDDMDAFTTMHGTYTVTPEFMTDWEKWYMTHETTIPFDDERFGGYFSRRPTHLLKLCMIMNASREDGNMVITSADLKRSMKILFETEKRMRETFGGIGRARLVDVQNRVMKMFEESSGRIPASQILSKFYYDASKQDMAEILATLTAMNFIEADIQEDDTYFTYIREGSRREKGGSNHTDTNVGSSGTHTS